MTVEDPAAEDREKLEALRRKCYMLAKEIGLTDEDRHELSVAICGERRSWQKFNQFYVVRCAEYLTGWMAINTILRDRRPTP